MTTRRPLPPDLLGRPFTASEAKRRGIRPDRLSDPDLDHPFHGVHGAGIGAGVVTMCTAYRLRMRDDAVFMSVTAAQLWDMPLPERLVRDGRLHVGVPLGGAACSATGWDATRFPSCSCAASACSTRRRPGATSPRC